MAIHVLWVGLYQHRFWRVSVALLFEGCIDCCSASIVFRYVGRGVSIIASCACLPYKSAICPSSAPWSSMAATFTVHMLSLHSLSRTRLSTIALQYKYRMQRFNFYGFSRYSYQTHLRALTATPKALRQYHPWPTKMALNATSQNVPVYSINISAYASLSWALYLTLQFSRTRKLDLSSPIPNPPYLPLSTPMPQVQHQAAVAMGRA